MDELLTTREASAYLGVGPTAVKRWADDGTLPCFKTHGGHRRFKRSDLEKHRNTLGDGGSERAGWLENWLNVLLGLGDDTSGYVLESMLLSERGRQGNWAAVAESICEVLCELGERWLAGQVTIRQEHFASERLLRALANIAVTIPVSRDAARALLVAVPNDQHTLALALGELCLREGGWYPVWAGRDTPTEEIVSAVDAQEVELVVASAAATVRDPEILLEWVATVGAACEASGSRLVCCGAGAWPVASSYGTRLQTFDELRAFLAGIGCDRQRLRSRRG